MFTLILALQIIFPSHRFTALLVAGLLILLYNVPLSIELKTSIIEPYRIQSKFYWVQ